MPLTFEAVPRGMMFEAVPRGMMGKHYNQPGPGQKMEPMEETARVPFVYLQLCFGERHYLQNILGQTCPLLPLEDGGAFPKLELGLLLMNQVKFCVLGTLFSGCTHPQTS